MYFGAISSLCAPLSGGTLLIGLLALLFNLVPIVLAIRFRKYVREFPSRKWQPFAPFASVLLPCKGLDEGLSENLDAVLGQVYPTWEVLFVVAEESDPCVEVIRAAIARNPSVPCKLLFSGHNALCSEKNHNHLMGLRHVDPRTEALVFIDSDIRPPPGWLADLVRPLGDSQFGATTGYRMIFPSDRAFASMLRSSWSMMSMAVLANDKLNGTWAGSMAILKTNFDRLGIGTKWERALCDGPLVASSVKEAGLRICFVPSCIVATNENATLLGLIGWTNRQMTIAKVYLNRMWMTAFLAYGLTNLFFLTSVVLLIAGGIAGRLDPALVLLLSHAPLTWLMGWLMLRSARQAAPYDAEKYEKLPLRFLMSMPMTSLLGLINILASMPTNQVTWRGVRYAMIAPGDVRVLKRESVSAIRY